MPSNCNNLLMLRNIYVAQLPSAIVDRVEKNLFPIVRESWVQVAPALIHINRGLVHFQQMAYSIGITVIQEQMLHSTSVRIGIEYN